MFEKVGRAAEKMAAGVSRRQFLGRLGRGAAAAAAVLGGMTAISKIGTAGPPKICGPNSFGTCVGVPVGSECGAGGACKQIRGSNDCDCVTKSRRK
jgi:hypothetical protein